MRILSSGSVGIGTSAPASLFHLYENNTTTNAASGLTIEQAGTGDAKLQFLLSGVLRWVFGVDNSDSDKFKIGRGIDWVSGVDVTIDSSGNVGIGTTSPGEKLEVNGNIQLTADNNLLKFGTGEDASITYDGTNMVIDPKVVGTGILDISGRLQTDGYNAVDGTAGLAGTKVYYVSDTSGGAVNRKLTFKDGLLVAET
jgi:hypothetical protein